MKAKIVLLVVCMVVSMGILAFAVGKVVVQKHTVWTLPADYSGTLTIARGDVIEVRTVKLPMIRENLDIDFQASKKGSGIEFVGSVFPHKEGTTERLFLFKAFDAGTATIKIELLNADKSTRTIWNYTIRVK